MVAFVRGFDFYNKHEYSLTVFPETKYHEETTTCDHVHHNVEEDNA